MGFLVSATNGFVSVLIFAFFAKHVSSLSIAAILPSSGTLKVARHRALQERRRCYCGALAFGLRLTVDLLPPAVSLTL